MKNYITVLSMMILMPLIGNSTTILVNGKAYNGECQEIHMNAEIVDFNAIETDEYYIQKMEIEDDCLIIGISYGGGCGMLDFELISNGLVTESMMPETQLFLKLTDNDFCKAIKYVELKFDISQFQNLRSENGLIFKIGGTDVSAVWK